MSDIRKTPLFDLHVELGGKIVDFSGWQMPIRYGSVLDEHRAVREVCGVFDVSHMGEFRVTGTDAVKFLQHVTINDVTRLKDGGGQYSALLNEKGGMIDDLIIYRLHENEYFICVNAANISKDFSWMSLQSKAFNVKLVNESESYGQLALQGPMSRQVMAQILASHPQKDQVNSLPYTNIMPFTYAGAFGYLARTGYTGELGYEIYLPAKATVQLWQDLQKIEAPKVTPIGLGARDSLRTEACYLLYGSDMNDDTTPLEAGIGWATRLEKPEFIGKAVLLKQKEKGIPNKLLTFLMTEPGIPRHDMKVWYKGEVVGKVTSGGVLPSLGNSGGMVFVKNLADLKEGATIEIEIRDNKKQAQIVKKPLYQAKVKD